VQNRNRAEIADRNDIIPVGKPSHVGDIADDPKLNRHMAQLVVQILHHEQAVSRLRQVLAEVLMAKRIRQVYLEMRDEVANLDEADVVLENHTTVAKRDAGRSQAQNGQGRCERLERASRHGVQSNLSTSTGRLNLLLRWPQPDESIPEKTAAPGPNSVNSAPCHGELQHGR